VYLGDCAAPAFLRNLQELLEAEPGITTEQSGTPKLIALEEIPPYDNETGSLEYAGSLTDYDDLVDVFFASVGVSSYIETQKIAC
jgi:hypothetical protein